MFERYTERARRAIFFARYEASKYGSENIDTEHLLLGLIREDRLLSAKVPMEVIRKQIEERVPPRQAISTSVDLPLSQEAKRALFHAAHAAQALNHKHIDTGHLILGLLRERKCVAAEMLIRNGLDYDTARNLVRSSDEPPEREVIAPAREKTAAPSLETVVSSFHSLISRAALHLKEFSDSDGDKPLAKRDWSRKEALGHLVDWATTHQQWFARALSEPKLIAAAYPMDDWVHRQNYGSFSWYELVKLWELINLLLVHVFTRIPEEKLNTVCRIGIGDPIPLSQLIDNYVQRCEDFVGQILIRG